MTRSAEATGRSQSGGIHCLPRERDEKVVIPLNLSLKVSDKGNVGGTDFEFV